MLKMDSIGDYSDGFSIRGIFNKVRDAVVTIIHGEERYNGFFILGHYIICPHTKAKDDIYVEIQNLNGTGKAYIYPAFVVGSDPYGGIDVIRLVENVIVNHPYLPWGKSRSCASGDAVIIVGSPFGSSSNNVYLTNLANNRCSSDYLVGELLSLPNILPPNTISGLPVINLYGMVIGMYIKIPPSELLDMNNIQSTFALSEYFMRFPVKGLIRCYQDGNVPKRYIGHVEDGIYKASSLGLRGTMKSCRVGLAIGYSITYIDNMSTLKDKLICGDILTHINNFALGNRKDQISASLVMSRVKIGETVNITFLREDKVLEITCESIAPININCNI